MPHPEQTSTPASSPDGEVATTNWPMPVFKTDDEILLGTNQGAT